jgi:hypothetical protein
VLAFSMSSASFHWRTWNPDFWRSSIASCESSECLPATAAAAGVLTPMPCVPVTPAPWTPGAAMVQLGGMPALHDGCTLQCVWGGVISVVTPGQVVVDITEAPTPRKGKRRGAR